MSHRHPVRTILSTTTALTLITTASILASATPATARFGEADINPIESNLAAKFWTTTTASSGASTAELATDQNPNTTWTPDDQTAGSWLTLDLGGTYHNLRKVHLTFPTPGAIYQHLTEASPDGETWHTIADHRDATQPSRGTVDLFTQPDTRYLRVTITAASPGATIGITELAAYNYLRDELTLGADLSNVDNFQDRDYWVNPLAEDRGAGPELLDVVQDRGMEYIRLRIWNEPRSENTGNPTAVPRQGPERSLTSAQWIAERDLGLGIDFHYADSWADPGKQPKPRAWAELAIDDLVTALHDFTHDYVTQLVEQGTTPDKVAIGNEVNNGFLWGSEATNAPAPGPVIGTANPPYFRNQPEIYQSQPGGGILWQYWDSEDPAQRQLYEDSWDRFSTLVAAGIAAVRDASPQTKVEIHSLVGSGVGERTGLEKALEYWDQLVTRVNAKGQDFDVIGLSFYPEFHGTIERLELNLHTIATAYPQYEMEVPETAYPASGGGTQPNSPYPRTIQGQADAIQHVFQVVNDIIDNRGLGVLTWEPASFQTMFRSVPGMANTWEPHSSIDIYNQSVATHILQDTIYTTTLTGQNPDLPSTVDLLTTADNTIEEIPVQWDTSDTTTPGELTLTGTTDHGSVTAIVSVVDTYATVTCDRILTGRRTGPLAVSTGTTCLNGATITGPVTIRPGAGLTSTDSRITGPLTAHHAAVILLCDTRITGPVTLNGGTSVTLGAPTLDCGPNRITGPVTITGTTGWNTIAGNTITGPLTCTGNQPPPANHGHPNTVTGPASGQCRTL